MCLLALKFKNVLILSATSLYLYSDKNLEFLTFLKCKKISILPAFSFETTATSKTLSIGLTKFWKIQIIRKQYAGLLFVVKRLETRKLNIRLSIQFELFKSTGLWPVIFVRTIGKSYHKKAPRILSASIVLGLQDQPLRVTPRYRMGWPSPLLCSS